MNLQKSTCMYILLINSIDIHFRLEISYTGSLQKINVIVITLHFISWSYPMHFLQYQKKHILNNTSTNKALGNSIKRKLVLKRVFPSSINLFWCLQVNLTWDAVESKMNICISSWEIYTNLWMIKLPKLISCNLYLIAFKHVISLHKTHKFILNLMWIWDEEIILCSK